MRISDWSSDVCSSDLSILFARPLAEAAVVLVPDLDGAELRTVARDDGLCISGVGFTRGIGIWRQALVVQLVREIHDEQRLDTMRVEGPHVAGELLRKGVAAGALLDPFPVLLVANVANARIGDQRDDVDKIGRAHV